MTFVRKSLYPESSNDDMAPLSIARGRAHVAVLRQDSVHVHYINVHNHDLQRKEIDMVKEYVKDKLDKHHNKDINESHTVVRRRLQLLGKR